MGAEEKEERVGVQGKHRPETARQNWCWEGRTGMGSLTGCGARGKIRSRCHVRVQWQRRSNLRQWAMISFDDQHGKLVTKQAKSGWEWRLGHLHRQKPEVPQGKGVACVTRGRAHVDPEWFGVGRDTPVIVCCF